MGEPHQCEPHKRHGGAIAATSLTLPAGPVQAGGHRGGGDGSGARRRGGGGGGAPGACWITYPPPAASRQPPPPRLPPQTPAAAASTVTPAAAAPVPVAPRPHLILALCHSAAGPSPSHPHQAPPPQAHCRRGRSSSPPGPGDVAAGCVRLPASAFSTHLAMQHPLACLASHAQPTPSSTQYTHPPSRCSALHCTAPASLRRCTSAPCRRRAPPRRRHPRDGQGLGGSLPRRAGSHHRGAAVLPGAGGCWALGERRVGAAALQQRENRLHGLYPLKATP